MASTTPQASGSSAKRSTSAPRRPLSRPTTPLRPSSRSSLHDSAKKASGGLSSAPLEAFEPAFAELSDSMADLEANFMHLQLMHESLARFSENFASFLYGLNMNAFCVDFPEAPIPDSFRRAQEQEEQLGKSTSSERFRGEIDGETTFLTTDTSFVDNPPTSSKASKFSTPAPSRIASASNRGGSSAGSSGRGGTRGGRGGRGSGLARARGRGVR
ncbi:DASH complex subunit Dam1 protein [Rutstroemia sp. NJR-2017a WRK4]|nr:DASH complex subunit Dam1 protein [Rutstroemia sp. NJR-2017a WRK4]PQE32293.1 DASH complex subunit Dam1 protein [Rutstroemia sp. NJR-2017a WRK4]